MNTTVAIQTVTAPTWMRATLKLAAVYNVVYAVALAVMPGTIFHLLALPDTPDVMVRCIGMMVGIYALCYWVASLDINRFWPLVTVGLLGKVLGPLGFFQGLLTGVFTLKNIWFIAFSDLIWWVPFSMITVYAYTRRNEWMAVQGG